MNTTEFLNRLQKHDWYYDFSDDPRVVAVGEREERALTLAATESPDHFKIFARYANHYLNQVPSKEQALGPK